MKSNVSQWQQRKPAVGMALSMILGIVGAILALLNLQTTIIGGTSPAIGVPAMIGASMVVLVANAAIITGTIMLIMDHLSGARVIWITSCFMAIFTVLFACYAYYTVVMVNGTLASNPHETAVTGSAIGDAIGGMLEWIVLMMLVRPMK